MNQKSPKSAPERASPRPNRDQGFPEDVGRRIWKRALSDGNCERNLRVFADAYPRSFLPDCRIASLVLLDDRVDLWPAVLLHVRSLDLSDCQMGDQHELVGELHRFASLRRLSLRGNLLTPAGVRRLVLPALANGSAFASLAYLDLRDNCGVDGAAVARVATSMAALERVAVTLPPAEERRACDRLEGSFRRMTRPHLEPLGATSGWAAELLHAWSRRLDEKALRRKRTAEDRRRGFYGSNKRLRLEREVPAAAAQCPKSREKGRVVMFHRSGGVRDSKEMVGVKLSGTGQTWIKHKSSTDPDASILNMYKK